MEYNTKLKAAIATGVAAILLLTYASVNETAAEDIVYDNPSTWTIPVGYKSIMNKCFEHSHGRGVDYWEKIKAQFKDDIRNGVLVLKGEYTNVETGDNLNFAVRYGENRVDYIKGSVTSNLICIARWSNVGQQGA